MFGLEKKTKATENVQQMPNTYTRQHTAKIKLLKAYQNKQKRIILSVFSLVILVCAGVIIFNTMRYQKLNQDLQTVEADLNQISKENDVLEKEIILFNDPDYVAKYARAHYHMSHDNEVIFIPE